MTVAQHLLQVILGGTSGKRLWPISQEAYPKQFLALTGSSTQLQDMTLGLYWGAGGICGAPHAIFICNTAYRFVAASQLVAVGIWKARMLLESAGRNTALVLTQSVLRAYHGADDLIMLAIPAGHVMKDLPRFMLRSCGHVLCR